MNNFLEILNIFKKLDDKISQKLIVIFFLMVIVASLELFGIVLIIPIVEISFSKNYLENEYIQIIINLFDIKNASNAIILLSSTILVFFILKAFIIIKANKYIINFTNNLNANISSKIFNNFLYKPYSFFLDKNTNILLKNILTDANQMTNQVFLGHISLFSELIIVSFLYLFMLYNSFILTLAATFFIGIFVVLFKRYSSRRLIESSKQRDVSWDGVFKNAMDGLNGIKEVKTYYLYDIFLNRFKYFFLKYAQADTNFAVLNILPRYIFEAIFMSIIIISLMVLTINEINMIEILPILTAFIFVIIKLIPSLTKTISLLNNVKYYSNSVDHIKNTFLNFEFLNNKDSEKIEFNHKITIKDGSFSYPSKDKKLFYNLNIEIHKNKTIAFVGKSGSGKSTLIDLLMGFLSFEKNSLYIDDNKCMIDDVRKIAGYIPQNNFIFDETLKFNICFGDDDDEKLSKVIKMASLEDVVSQLENGVNEKIGQNGISLSGGQRQRIGIARSLYKDAKILIFDEATSALDNQTEKEITQSIEKLQGKYTIIIIAHRISTIKNSDSIYVLKSGEVKGNGSFNELKKNCEEFQKLLGDK